MSKLFLELFGYLGTALVLLSMMMTSVVKLRIFNLAGSVVSMIYAFLTGTWPVVLLNFGLTLINIAQLMRLNRKTVSFTYVEVAPEDSLLGHFLKACDGDIQTYFPGYRYTPGEDTQVHMVFDGTEAVGVMIGKREGDTFHGELDYVTRKYRDCSIASFVLKQLKAAGCTCVTEPASADAHNRYLEKMGFRQESGQYIRTL